MNEGIYFCRKGQNKLTGESICIEGRIQVQHTSTNLCVYMSSFSGSFVTFLMLVAEQYIQQRVFSLTVNKGKKETGICG